MDWQELARELREATHFAAVELPPGLQTREQRRQHRIEHAKDVATYYQQRPPGKQQRKPRWRKPQDEQNRATARKNYARRQLGYTPEQQAARLEHQQLRILAGTQRRGRPRKD